MADWSPRSNHSNSFDVFAIQIMMSKNFRKILPLFSILILSMLAFLFMHSELGVASEQDKQHDKHDFCDLVSNSVIFTSKTLELLKSNFSQLHSVITVALLHFYENKVNFAQPVAKTCNQFHINSSRLSFLQILLI
jgi:hypothetical protein